MKVQDLIRLSRPKTPQIVIEFMREDKKHVYYSCVNDLTGDRLSGFDNSPPYINNTIAEVRAIVRKIKAESKVFGLSATKPFRTEDFK